MRLRRKPWARPELAACPFVAQQPRLLRGAWREFFAAPGQPLHVELGCGKGAFIAQTAKDQPHINFLAVDIKSEMLALAKRNAERVFEGREVPNLRLAIWNIEHIGQLFSPGDRVERLYIHFCNPWSRPRDWKHRLTHPRQLAQYREFLAPGGELRFKTDDCALFLATMGYLVQSGFEQTLCIEHLPDDHPASAVMTEHERMFRAEGLPIYYLEAVLRP